MFKDILLMLYFNYQNNIPLDHISWSEGNTKSDNFLRVIMFNNKGTWIINGGPIIIKKFVEKYKTGKIND